jgi:hypothetical protein
MKAIACGVVATALLGTPVTAQDLAGPVASRFGFE